MDEHNEIMQTHAGMLASFDARIDSLEVARDDTKQSTLDHTARLTELERTVDTMTERNHHYEKSIDIMGKDIQILGEKQETLKERMPSKDEWLEVKNGIKELTTRNGKNYDKVKDIIITVIISCIITYALTQVLVFFASKGGTP
jgi:chromosome segregation ATPase